MPPPKYRNTATSDQAKYLKAHQYPVPNRRGVSVSNPNRRVHKRIYNPVDGIRTVGRDFPLGQAIPEDAVANDAQIGRDDASDNFIEEKLHSNIRASNTDPIPAVLRTQRQGSGGHCINPTRFGVAGTGVGSIAEMRSRCAVFPASFGRCDRGQYGHRPRILPLSKL